MCVCVCACVCESVLQVCVIELLIILYLTSNKFSLTHPRDKTQ